MNFILFELFPLFYFKPQYFALQAVRHRIQPPLLSRSSALPGLHWRHIHNLTNAYKLEVMALIINDKLCRQWKYLTGIAISSATATTTRAGEAHLLPVCTRGSWVQLPSPSLNIGVFKSDRLCGWLLAMMQLFSELLAEAATGALASAAGIVFVRFVQQRRGWHELSMRMPMPQNTFVGELSRRFVDRGLFGKGHQPFQRGDPHKPWEILHGRTKLRWQYVLGVGCQACGTLLPSLAYRGV